jgi:hypothetical protein
MPASLPPTSPADTRTHVLATVRELIEQHRPQMLLQVGLADVDSLLAVCHLLRARAQGQLTLVDDRLHNDLSWRPQLRTLRQHKLDDVLDIVGNHADRALPDFYFQEQSFDLALFVPGERRDENQVVLYYLERLLAPGAALVVTASDAPAMQGLLRERLACGNLEVLGPVAGQRLSRVERLLRDRYGRLPHLLRDRIEAWVRPERLRPDSELGLDGPCVVLRRPGVPDDEHLDVERLLAELSIDHDRS